MIIPPDPEKDPRLFDPSASTPSLVQPPSEFDDTTSRWDGDSESLPPYERRRNSTGGSTISSRDENDIFSDHHQHHVQITNNRSSRNPVFLPGLSINNLPTQPQPIHPSPVSSSNTLTPTTSRPSFSLPHFNQSPSQPSGSGSTSKLWENSSISSSSSVKGKRRCSCLPIPPHKIQRFWNKWKRWIQAFLVLFFIGIGLTVGLLVGMSRKENKSPPIAPWQKPWMDQDTDGKRVAAWAGYGSFNLTYIESRDGPSSNEGLLVDCNKFTPLNLTSSPFTKLFTPFPQSTSTLASFSFPFSSSGLPPSDLFINTRGFGSSGTLQFPGTEAPESVILSGEEGKILIDVVVRYSGAQDLNTMMRVCKMTRGDSGVGIGIYSPRETDGKLTNPFKLNPNLIPTNLIIIRLPPSIYSKDTPPLNLPSFSLDAQHLVVRLGKLNNVVSFDTLNLDTCRGGVQVGYTEAKKASIVAFEGSVSGTWNVSESLIVNVTDGSITSDVILTDANNSTDNATTLPPISDYTVFRRTPTASPTDSSDDSEDDFEQEVHSLFNSTSTGTSSSIIGKPNNTTKPIVITNLFTTSGYVNLRYLHQPSSVDLSAIIGTQQGNMNIQFHPNYIGPFITRTHWGQINIPPPLPISELDPTQKSRIRNLLIEPIAIKNTTNPESIFGVLGYTQDKLMNSSDTLSGYVYWSDTNTKPKWNPNGTGNTNTNKVFSQTMEQLQNDTTTTTNTGSNTMTGSSNNNQVLVLGDWGDIDITFDGQYN